MDQAASVWEVRTCTPSRSSSPVPVDAAIAPSAMPMRLPRATTSPAAIALPALVYGSFSHSCTRVLLMTLFPVKERTIQIKPRGCVGGWLWVGLRAGVFAHAAEVDGLGRDGVADLIFQVLGVKVGFLRQHRLGLAVEEADFDGVDRAVVGDGVGGRGTGIIAAGRDDRDKCRRLALCDRIDAGRCGSHKPAGVILLGDGFEGRGHD